ncbi:molybdopterin-dependent oxidoreductase [Cognatishimia activa]|uniref:molybdopterin-dependent oxidoreductase n=1 Tax=Cognatishimia activa TaxID=1715691 RepID=UPI00222FED3C|nr:molybdopterin-dependent oxidoreductase [Cognatishimia activa]UZD89990.1 molybdopterin-dependent oxidoreductase [Cognatishimia activa]
MILKRFLALCVVLLLPGVSAAEEITAPSGPVILTVTGDIARTNGEGAAHFDLQMLAEMPVTTFETTTIWTEGAQLFTGVELHTLAEKLGVQGDHLVASAINDYHVEIPMTDAQVGGPILAYMRNGEVMSVRNKGPLWIVYPYDSNVAYRTETIYSRSIWQLDRIKVMK